MSATFGDGGIDEFTSDVAIGDFNGDGNNDLAIIGGSYPLPSSTLEILFGNGLGAFTSSVSFGVGDGDQIWGTAVGDVNGDGLTDLVLAVSIGSGESAGSGFFVLPNLFDGGQRLLGPFISGPITVDSSSGYFDVAIAVADFNSDGISDVALSSIGNGVDLFYGLSDGGFMRVPGVFPGSDAGGAPQLSTGDLDGDGRADLAIVSGPDVTVLLQTADGLAASGPEVQCVEATAVITGRSLNCVGFQGAITTYVLNRDGGLDEARMFQSPDFQPGTGITFALAADVNSDGVPDLLADDLQTLMIWLNQGSPAGFGQAATITAASAFYGPFAVGDLNGDGRPDIARTGPFAQVTILLNDCSP